VIYVAAIFAGVVLLLFLEAEQAHADSGAPAAGDLGTDFYYQYPAPPADIFSNAEVGDVISGGSGMAVTAAKIDQLAQAIAKAEGWTNPNPNVVPRRAHNPGDLIRSFGQRTEGVANPEGVLIFADDNAGWSALKGEATGMLTGGSHVYSPAMTLLELARKYTGGDHADSWAANAASVLGISPDQTLEDFLAI
jgi:hypothetical protein